MKWIVTSWMPAGPAEGVAYSHPLSEVEVQLEVAEIVIGLVPSRLDSPPAWGSVIRVMVFGVEGFSHFWQEPMAIANIANKISSVCFMVYSCEITT